MGGIVSQMCWGGDPDTVNPISGLSKRDVYAVQKSWRPANANPVETGTELFTRLFHVDPETKEFFKMLRNIPESQHRGNYQFKAHVINLVSSINLAVVNLHQPEVVAAMMNRLGESHGKRKIKEKHFHELKDVIVKMFPELLKVDESTLASCSKTIDFLYKHIFETLNEDVLR